MILTASELAVLSHISGNEMLFGVPNKSVRIKEQENFVQQTTESLKEKGILDNEGKLRKKGTLPIYILEQYKKAKKHLIINNIKLAVLPTHKVISIIPVENGYDLSTEDSVVFFTQFMGLKEYFGRADFNVNYERKKYKVYEDWEKEFQKYRDDYILIGAFDEKKVIEEIVLYWDEEMGYLFDLHSVERKEMSPRMMRLHLMELLDINYRNQIGGMSNGK